MNWLKAIGLALTLGFGLVLSGCASSTSSDTYSRGQVGDINETMRGVVVSSRAVKIEGTKSGVGTIAGAAAGGAAGSQIGGGRAENIVGGIAGAVAGGLIGAAAEEQLTKGQGIEYIVELEDGRTVTIVQGADNAIPPGTPVLVILGERARIVPQ